MSNRRENNLQNSIKVSNDMMSFGAYVQGFPLKLIQGRYRIDYYANQIS